MLRTGIFATALMITGCAATGSETAASGRECFRSDAVNGFDVLDQETIEVRVGASRRYLLSIAWPAANLDYSQRIALRSSTGMICTGNGLGVEIIGGDPIQSYPVQSIARAPEPEAQG